MVKILGLAKHKSELSFKTFKTRKPYSHTQKSHGKSSKWANTAEKHRSGNKAIKAQLIGMKVKFHLFCQRNDASSPSLAERNHWNHSFSTINIF